MTRSDPKKLPMGVSERTKHSKNSNSYGGNLTLAPRRDISLTQTGLRDKYGGPKLL